MKTRDEWRRGQELIDRATGKREAAALSATREQAERLTREAGRLETTATRGR